MKGNVLELGQITEETICSWAQRFEKRKKYFYCKECGHRALQTTVHVSIHLKLFEPEHAGPGRVLKINYPYCPKCDGKIDYATACYHVDIAEPHPLLINEGGVKVA